MAELAIIFFGLAVLAAVLGFGDLVSALARVSRYMVALFLVLTVVTLVL